MLNDLTFEAEHKFFVASSKDSTNLWHTLLKKAFKQTTGVFRVGLSIHS